MLNNYKTSTNVNPFKNLFTKEDEREVQNQIGNIAFWVPKEWGDREKTINQFAKDVVNRKISELGERSGQEIPSGFELDVKLKSGEDPSELSSYQVRLSGNQFSATTTLDRLVEGLKNASAPQTSSAVNYSATSASNTLPPNPKTGVDQTYGAKSGNLFDWFKKFFTVDKTDDFYDIGDLWNDVTGWFKGGKKKNDSKSTSSATTSSSSSSPAVSSQSSSASSSKASSVAASSDSASSGAKNLTKTADELIYQEYQEYQKAKEDGKKVPNDLIISYKIDGQTYQFNPQYVISNLKEKASDYSQQYTETKNKYFKDMADAYEQACIQIYNAMVGMDTGIYKGGEMECVTYAVRRSNAYFGLPLNTYYGIRNAANGLNNPFDGSVKFEKITSEQGLESVKPGSIVFFMPKENSQREPDPSGHTIFVEGVTVENGEIYIYYSETNIPRHPQGVIQKAKLKEISETYSENGTYGKFNGAVRVKLD